MTAPIPNGCSQRIAVDPVTGLHAMVSIQAGGYPPFAWLWTGLDDLHYQDISDGFPQFVTPQDCQVAFADVGPTLVVAGVNPANTPFLASEWAVTPTGLVKGSGYQWGDKTSRWGATCPLSDGSQFFVNWCDNPNLCVFDVAIRRPAYPALVAPVLWWSQRFSMATNCFIGPNTTSPYFISVAEGPDGNVWLFFTRDSAGTVALVRFAVSNGQATLVDYNSTLIPRGSGDCSISQEYPQITAVPDPRTRSILLTYPGVSSIPDPVTSGSWMYPTAITRVKADLSFESVAVLPYYGPQTLAPRPVAWPRPDAAYFFVPAYPPNNWLGGSVDLTSKAVATLPPLATTSSDTTGLQSYSDDGWFVFHESDGSFSLYKSRFKPWLTVERWQVTGGVTESVRLTWDQQQTGDVIEACDDLANRQWTTVAGGSGTIIANTGTQRFFRIKQL